MPPETTILKLTTHRRRLWCTTLFVRFLVLVLSLAVLGLVLEAIQYSNPAYWSASSREPPRSAIGIAAVQTAVEYEYRFTEYRPPRRTEYEYDEIRCDRAPKWGGWHTFTIIIFAHWKCAICNSLDFDSKVGVLCPTRRFPKQPL